MAVSQFEEVMELGDKFPDDAESYYDNPPQPEYVLYFVYVVPPPIPDVTIGPEDTNHASEDDGDGYWSVREDDSDF